MELFHYFLLLPTVHLVESHVCKVESVHPVDDFARVVRLGGLLQDPHHLQSSSSLVKKRRSHLWNLIGHPLGEVVSVLNRLVGAFPLLQSHYLLFLLLHQRTDFESMIITWFKIWMNIFMLQMRMGARVLICSRCWARLSRWLGFKRSFWRPSTSWDTWYRRGIILAADMYIWT